jgi:hypothetical protein
MATKPFWLRHNQKAPDDVGRQGLFQKRET